MATFEEAKCCPKCGVAGNIRVTKTNRDRSKLLTIYCENPRCKWYDTPWNVSVLADGSIPDPQSYKGPKTYVGFEHDNEEAQRVINALTLEAEASKNVRR